MTLSDLERRDAIGVPVFRRIFTCTLVPFDSDQIRHGDAHGEGVVFVKRLGTPRDVDEAGNYETEAETKGFETKAETGPLRQRPYR